MNSIGTTRVKEIMVTAIVTVDQRDKMDKVARFFEEKDINAAPVVDADGKCVGIITSHDLVEYEAVRIDMENELNHGRCYDLAHYGSGGNYRMPGQHFDEAGFHMTQKVDTAMLEDTLSQVAKSMCLRHIHHVLVLDDERKPLGLLSSLDILGYVIGAPVCRSATCGDES